MQIPWLFPIFIFFPDLQQNSLTFPWLLPSLEFPWLFPDRWTPRRNMLCVLMTLSPKPHSTIDWWIPLTKGQQHGKSFHLMMSSWKNECITLIKWKEIQKTRTLIVSCIKVNIDMFGVSKPWEKDFLPRTFYHELNGVHCYILYQFVLTDCSTHSGKQHETLTGVWGITNIHTRAH